MTIDEKLKKITVVCNPNSISMENQFEGFPDDCFPLCCPNCGSTSLRSGFLNSCSSKFLIELILLRISGVIIPISPRKFIFSGKVHLPRLESSEKFTAKGRESKRQSIDLLMLPRAFIVSLSESPLRSSHAKSKKFFANNSNGTSTGSH